MPEHALDRLAGYISRTTARDGEALLCTCTQLLDQATDGLDLEDAVYVDDCKSQIIEALQRFSQNETSRTSDVDFLLDAVEALRDELRLARTVLPATPANVDEGNVASQASFRSSASEGGPFRTAIETICSK